MAGASLRPLKLRKLSLHPLVVGAPASALLPATSSGSSAAAAPWSNSRLGLSSLILVSLNRASLTLSSLTLSSLTLASGLLVTLPVFLQAPWVRLAPFSAAVFTAPLLALALLLSRHRDPRLARAGELLVGFCGSWLGGCLFWGWFRLHPLWHLPIEAFALPLALTGLRGRWKLACAFYLGSLLGTAATDAAMAATGVMTSWPQVLSASPPEASLLLQSLARQVLSPLHLTLVISFAAALIQACRWLWRRGEAGRICSAALATTLAVDGLFLLAALGAPVLTGLI